MADLCPGQGEKQVQSALYQSAAFVQCPGQQVRHPQSRQHRLDKKPASGKGRTFKGQGPERCWHAISYSDAKTLLLRASWKIHGQGQKGTSLKSMQPPLSRGRRRRIRSQGHPWLQIKLEAWALRYFASENNPKLTPTLL